MMNAEEGWRKLTPERTKQLRDSGNKAFKGLVGAWVPDDSPYQMFWSGRAVAYYPPIKEGE